MSETTWISRHCAFFLVTTVSLGSASASVSAASACLRPFHPARAGSRTALSKWTARPSTSTRPLSTAVPRVTALCSRNPWLASLDFSGKVEIIFVFKGKLKHVDVRHQSI